MTHPHHSPAPDPSAASRRGTGAPSRLSPRPDHRPRASRRARPGRLLPAAAATLGVLLLGGCAVAPERATEPAGRNCTKQGRVCDVRLVRGADPVVVRSGKEETELWVVRLSDAKNRGVEVATRRYDKPFEVPGRPGYVPEFDFRAGTGGLGTTEIENAQLEIRSMSVDTAELRVTFDRPRGR